MEYIRGVKQGRCTPHLISNQLFILIFPSYSVRTIKFIH